MPPSNLSEIGPPTGRLIALETSGRQGSVTLMEVGANEQKALLTRELPPQERSARTLVPTIQELLAEIGWNAKDIHCVAVAIGPGSFTGLRVGVTTAKTLAYVAGAKLIAVNTLDALAEPSWLEEPPPLEAPHEKDSLGGSLWSVLDAQRNEVFAARYESPLTSHSSNETQVQRFTQAEFFFKLKPGDRVVAPHAPVLSNRCEVESLTWTTAQPMADAVARLGVAKWQTGELADPFQLTPQYHRPSAAEENLPH